MLCVSEGPSLYIDYESNKFSCLYLHCISLKLGETIPSLSLHGQEKATSLSYNGTVNDYTLPLEQNA